MNLRDRCLSLGIEWMESGLIPDAAIRFGIRRLCAQRLREQAAGPSAAAFAATMTHGEVAPVPHRANEQHYELPPEFFTLCLGPRRKYSCCYFATPETSLAEAEEAALAITCERAQLADGQQILELGCGWGSLSLWMAERYPAARITAVSNSAPQRAFITAEAARRGFNNLQVITADMNYFQPPATYDRVVSVEMFEHMRNYRELLRRVSTWLNPGGRLFVHIFCHRKYAYPFEEEGSDNWMGRYFFTGGIMPSADIFTRFPEHLTVCEQCFWGGEHYQRTAEAWIQLLDRRQREVLEVLERTYGLREAETWLHRWRVFFLACAEFWGFRGGSEWQVGHYLLRRAGDSG